MRTRPWDVMHSGWRAGAAMILALLLVTRPLMAQGGAGRERVLQVARDLVKGATYATFVTIDGAGTPAARIVEPLGPDADFTTWVGTNPRTRKVADIARDPRVTLLWFDPKAGGYVTLRGRATLVTDRAARAAHFKAGWDAFYPDRERDFALLRVDPERLEVVSPSHGIVGDSLRWRPPSVDLRRRR